MTLMPLASPPDEPADQPADQATHRFTCASCELTSLYPAPPAEAQHLATIHDRLFHGGPQTATVILA